LEARGRFDIFILVRKIVVYILKYGAGSPAQWGEIFSGGAFLSLKEANAMYYISLCYCRDSRTAM
jgi:hypothetical protein